MFFTVLSLLAAFRSKKQFDEVGVLKALFWLGLAEGISPDQVLFRLEAAGVEFSAAAATAAKHQVKGPAKILELHQNEEMKATALRMAEAIGLGPSVYPLGRYLGRDVPGYEGVVMVEPSSLGYWVGIPGDKTHTDDIKLAAEVAGYYAQNAGIGTVAYIDGEGQLSLWSPAKFRELVSE